MASLIDSSVWVALYLENDPQHRKAQQYFDTHAGTIVVPYGVLSEVASILTYKHSKAQADRFVEFITTDVEVELIESDGWADAAFFSSLSSRISFIDASLLRLAKERRLKLVTYDKQLAALARKAHQ